jgi:hypothetical protein
MKSLLMSLALTICSVGAVYAQTGNGKKVYVWEFQSDTINDHGLMDSISDEFEEAVQDTGRYRLLERRQYNRLLSRRSDEIIDMHNLGNDDVRLLKGEGADAVFFGNIFNDSGSGTVRLTVTLESFAGAIEFKKSVRMKPYELYSDTVRAAKYKELLGVTATPQSTNSSPGGPNIPASTGGRHSDPTPGIDIASFTYRHLANARGPYSPMVRVRFDWNISNLPDGRCTFQIVAGNVVVDQGIQSGMTGRAEVTYNASLRDLTKTLTIACGSKSARTTALEAGDAPPGL